MIEQASPPRTSSCPTRTASRVRLSALRGRTVVVYFYPKADTPGCTTQACSIRDRGDEYAAAGAAVLGISPDPVKKVKRFHDKRDLNFTLLADEDHAVCDRYGVWARSRCTARRTGARSARRSSSTQQGASSTSSRRRRRRPTTTRCSRRSPSWPPESGRRRRSAPARSPASGDEERQQALALGDDRVEQVARVAGRGVKRSIVSVARARPRRSARTRGRSRPRAACRTRVRPAGTAGPGRGRASIRERSACESSDVVVLGQEARRRRRLGIGQRRVRDVEQLAAVLVAEACAAAGAGARRRRAGRSAPTTCGCRPPSRGRRPRGSAARAHRPTAARRAARPSHASRGAQCAWPLPAPEPARRHLDERAVERHGLRERAGSASGQRGASSARELGAACAAPCASSSRPAATTSSTSAPASFAAERRS